MINEMLSRVFPTFFLGGRGVLEHVIPEMPAFRHLFLWSGFLLHDHFCMKLFVLKAIFIVICLNNLMVNLLYFSIEVNVHGRYFFITRVC